MGSSGTGKAVGGFFFPRGAAFGGHEVVKTGARANVTPDWDRDQDVGQEEKNEHLLGFPIQERAELN